MNNTNWPLIICNIFAGEALPTENTRNWVSFSQRNQQSFASTTLQKGTSARPLNNSFTWTILQQITTILNTVASYNIQNFSAVFPAKQPHRPEVFLRGFLRSAFSKIHHISRMSSLCHTNKAAFSSPSDQTMHGLHPLYSFFYCFHLSGCLKAYLGEN